MRGEGLAEINVDYMTAGVFVRSYFLSSRASYSLFP